jgi:hypothetical protein
MDHGHGSLLPHHIRRRATVKPIKIKKLILSTQVLRRLVSSELDQVRGGYNIPTEVRGGCSTALDTKCSLSVEIQSD